MKTKEIYDFRKTYTDYKKPCVFEGYALAVLFDEKDGAKRNGARWNQDLKVWWIPKDKLKFNCDETGPGTVHEWLNLNCMIVGQYGEFDHEAFNTINRDSDLTDTKYDLVEDELGGRKITFIHYPELDMVEIRGQRRNDNYVTIDNARSIWEDLVKIGGYNLLVEPTSLVG